MSSIILATINARYYHSAFGLRWLLANLGPLRERAVIREFQLTQTPAQIVETLLADSPALIGLGVYIWNVTAITEVARILKAVRPDLPLVIGGPEASHKYESTELFALCDFLIRGEGEQSFAVLAQSLLAGGRPAQKVIDAAPPDLAALTLPYDLYTDEDIARRKVFVEASRGCPFRCEFCLSSLDPCVREFPLPPFFAALERLVERGAREFIFVDRTFNLNVPRVLAILDFFQSRWLDGMHLHFEIVPDRLGETLLQAIARFPAGALHLEVGLQTFNPVVQATISRRQDLERTLENMNYLINNTAAWVHADLIIGLPGESWESFGEGFDRLLTLRPQQIQVGVLKRLKGAPIARHSTAHAMVYSVPPPYEILQNDLIDFFQMQRLKRFARYFDLFYNSGNFPASLEMLWASHPSAFESFIAFSDFIWARTGRTHELALPALARHLFDYLVTRAGADPQAVAETINLDFHRLPGRREKLKLMETK